MADTLEAPRMHLSVRKGGPVRLIVWARNSHLGDARATELGQGGQLKALLHQLSADDPARIGRLLRPIRDHAAVQAALPDSLLERAIGVIYRPESERLSPYFKLNLRQQFDAVLHVDRSSAVRPLESSPRWTPEALPETYPSGL